VEQFALPVEVRRSLGSTVVNAPKSSAQYEAAFDAASAAATECVLRCFQVSNRGTTARAAHMALADAEVAAFTRVGVTAAANVSCAQPDIVPTTKLQVHANGSVTFNISVQPRQARHEVLSEVNSSGLVVRQQKILARLDEIRATASTIEAKLHGAPSQALRTSACELPPRSIKLDRVPSHEDAVAAAVTLAKQLLTSPLSPVRSSGAHTTGAAAPSPGKSFRTSLKMLKPAARSSGPVYYVQGPTGFVETSTSISLVAKDNEWVVVSPAKQQHVKTAATSVATDYQNSTADSVAAAVALAQKVLLSNCNPSSSRLLTDNAGTDELVGVFTQSPCGFTQSPIKTSDDDQWVIL